MVCILICASAIAVIFHVFLPFWVTGAVLVYGEREEDNIRGETKRFNRNTWQQPTAVNPADYSRGRTYCGQSLYYNIKLICKNSFYTPFETAIVGEPTSFASSSFSAKKLPLDSLTPAVQTPQIVQECCHKPCTISQFRKYCPNAKRATPPAAAHPKLATDSADVKVDNGFPDVPILLQLQDGYGSPLKSPPVQVFESFDIAATSSPRRNQFSLNPARPNVNIPGKMTRDVTYKKFQAFRSDEVEKDEDDDQEELLKNLKSNVQAVQLDRFGRHDNRRPDTIEVISAEDSDEPQLVVIPFGISDRSYDA